MATCSQPNCPIATTGVCLEGHTQGCPYLFVDNAGPSEKVIETTFEQIEPYPSEMYHFHSGEKLTCSEASRMLNALPARVVLCAGAQSAGKTTLLARIGELFRAGSFKGFRFAGSKTLCAFERSSWLATISSGAENPDTKRSHRVDKYTFYHLQDKRLGSVEHRFDILISDLPGELFREVLATKEICEEQLALACADHLVLFVDCASMIDSAKRHDEMDAVLSFLDQVAKCRHEPDLLYVTVVFSRWDYVLSHQYQERSVRNCSSLEVELQDRFSTAFCGLRFFRIAARPKGMDPTDLEIQELFNHLLEVIPMLPVPETWGVRRPARDFCAFGIK
jgi:hypothetical protein